MAAQGRNEGFYLLDEFVCEAVHAPTVPLASPANQGQNEGMSVVEELVFEASPDVISDEPDDPDSRRPSSPRERDAVLKSVIEPLANYIAVSSNPRGALAHAMELLLTEVHGIDRAAAAWLGQLCHANQSPEPGAAPDPARDIGSGSS